MIITYKEFIDKVKYIDNIRIQLQTGTLISVSEWELRLKNMLGEHYDDQVLSNCTFKLVFIEH